MHCELGRGMNSTRGLLNLTLLPIARGKVTFGAVEFGKAEPKLPCWASACVAASPSLAALNEPRRALSTDAF